MLLAVRSDSDPSKLLMAETAVCVLVDIVSLERCKTSVGFVRFYTNLVLELVWKVEGGI